MSISPDQIALTPEQKQHLARLAEESGKPWTSVLDEALRSFENDTRASSENGESVYAATLRLGLLGSVQDAPPDLSTNPKYMEGFGEPSR